MPIKKSKRDQTEAVGSISRRIASAEQRIRYHSLEITRLQTELHLLKKEQFESDNVSIQGGKDTIESDEEEELQYDSD